MIRFGILVWNFFFIFPIDWCILIIRIFYLVTLILFVRKIRIGWTFLSIISLVQVSYSVFIIWNLLNYKNLNTTARFELFENKVNFIIFTPILILLLTKRTLSIYKINNKEKMFAIISSIMIVTIYFFSLKYFYSFIFKHF